ncbi:hypothetical protein OLMES_4350 [Oleiphilus messinensis]|uniref:Uncharacterized protein n=1 Tax=Oleiphilus messinensis TaxID=141451 RepID=A0A1Y0ICS2_9GAMM|nr:hypothetical protein OLMES_4350 [Oleiphilus messinensis]
MDSRICQTFAVSPAEPGDFPLRVKPVARDHLTVHWEMDVARYNFVITDLSTCQRHLSVLLLGAVDVSK